MRLRVEQLESRLTPASLSLAGGVLSFIGDAGADNVTLAVSGGVYSLKDTSTTITLGSGAVAAGWRGNNTSTVSGPETSVDSIEIHVGTGANVVNVKSVHDPLFIWGDDGDTTVNLNSVAPTHIGNLAGITAEVTVNAGMNTTLNVSDYTGVSRPNTITIDATGITGLAANTIYLSGTFAVLHVWGSNSTTLAETYVITSPDATYFRLDTNGGADDVTVNGDVTGDFYLGSGDDVLTVDLGFTLYGDVNTGSGNDTVWYGGPLYGDITGSVV